MRLLAISGAFLTLLASALFFMEKSPVDRAVSMGTAPLFASAGTTYFGPKSPVTGNPHLVRVELLLKDASDSSGPQLKSVQFYNETIPLKPRDVYGSRGSASFQVPPGKYKLQWTISRDKFVWPREVDHEVIVTVSPRDLWLSIEIQGDQAKFN